MHVWVLFLEGDFVIQQNTLFPNVIPKALDVSWKILEKGILQHLILLLYAKEKTPAEHRDILRLN